MAAAYDKDGAHGNDGGGGGGDSQSGMEDLESGGEGSKIRAKEEGCVKEALLKEGHGQGNTSNSVELHLPPLVDNRPRLQDTAEAATAAAAAAGEGGSSGEGEVLLESRCSSSTLQQQEEQEQQRYHSELPGQVRALLGKERQMLLFCCFLSSLINGFKASASANRSLIFVVSCCLPMLCRSPTF